MEEMETNPNELPIGLKRARYWRRGRSSLPRPFFFKSHWKPRT